MGPASSAKTWRPSRRLTGVLGAAVGAVVVWLALPVRYEVEGVSMAPGFVPGDVVRSGPLPILDRWRAPERFERWVLEAEQGQRVIKRIVGLPGERVALAAGDLVVDGRTLLKGPRLLAQVGVRLPTASLATAASWDQEPRDVLDDAGVDSGRSTLLLPVRDVGLAAVVAVAGPPARCAARARVVVGRTAITVRLAAPGRHAIVAGRLDGNLVAAAWPLGESVDRDRSCLPASAPERWDVATAWPEEAVADDRSPRLAVMVTAVADGATAVLERTAPWRDTLLRPAADGTTAWQVGTDAVFVLGDHPAASRDSRQWGPVPLPSLRHRVAATAASAR
jgi:type IV secretory pathway protease TraF